MTYIFWLSLFVWTPTLLLWVCNFRYLSKFPRTIAFCVVGSLIFSVPWDIVAVRSNIWHFFDGHILDVWVVGLPIEEYLFIVSVAAYISTITLLLRKWIYKKGVA